MSSARLHCSRNSSRGSFAAFAVALLSSLRSSRSATNWRFYAGSDRGVSGCSRSTGSYGSGSKPWQNACVERVIGSIRRECLNYVVVFNERHLRRVLSSYVDYYHLARTHLSLQKDCPVTRPVCPPERGKVIAIKQVDGLHHRYERRAA